MAIESKNKHANTFVSNLNEVGRLTEIHSQITTKGPGRKYDVQILHKSAIVLLVACWEAYVEDLARETLKFMIENGKDHTVFPNFVLERVGSMHGGLKAWKLAGQGWKKEMRGNLDGVLAKTTGTLNTPKTAQVNDLFKKCIGLESLSSAWYWSGRSINQTTNALDDLVTLRGSIAHRVTTADSVTLKNVRDSRSFINRLAVRSHNRICKYVYSRIGKVPWQGLQFAKTI